MQYLYIGATFLVYRPAGKMKADLSSAEFGEALRIFRSVLGKVTILKSQAYIR